MYTLIAINTNAIYRLLKLGHFFSRDELMCLLTITHTHTHTHTRVRTICVVYADIAQGRRALVCEGMCVHVRMCMCEREREREYVHVCIATCVYMCYSCLFKIKTSASIT